MKTTIDLFDDLAVAEVQYAEHQTENYWKARNYARAQVTSAIWAAAYEAGRKSLSEEK